MADRCERSVGGYHLFCPGCWNQLPIDLRHRIQAALDASAPHLAVEPTRAARGWMAEQRAARIARIAGSS